MSDPTPSGQAGFDPAPILKSLPSLPGVYRMLGEDGAVLYVGKARDLKKRVSSYFQKTGLSPRIQLMVARIRDVQTTVTRTEGEALLLENNLIKGLAPRYNILFRDDKSYPYLLLSGHDYPRLGFFRGTPERRHRVFGPFPHSLAVRESIQILQKVFRLRTCEDTVFANRSRPCLLFQIKRCSGPCVGRVSAVDYARDAENAALFLEGKDNEVVAGLTARMQAAAAALRYEEAALYRDQIQALAQVRAVQFVESRSTGDVDVIAAVARGGLACVYLAMVRGGRSLGGRAFFPSQAEDSDLPGLLEAFAGQHYVGYPIPSVLVLECAVEGLAEALAEQAGRRVQVVVHPQGERRVWLEMARKNAELALATREGLRENQSNRLAALNEALGEEGIARIECFDVSHTLGEATVVSCVVFDQGAMCNAEYRRFNVANPTPGDDYAALREALSRRYGKLAQGEGKLPDLLLIDGGKGQLHVAVDVLTELGLGDLPMLGVAKGVERKAGQEQLFLPGEVEPLRLPPDHPGLHLIQQVRDEAHRFAITGHRARRGKARTQSSLEDIAGVGAKRRQKLLQAFGGLRGVIDAGVEELARVEGISRELAERIYRELH
ncbi:MAG: excinuclease ABC subunit C [bacterium]|nr:MAG: excinuclease ABC subunit C [bacterium]KAF0149892.1 MAG: excinuclease ABC subunit C [bacterium]KAF0166354.1 MAG: excinuclease ABC subunit C [bacterium]TXT16987.1 MAG: excinuclease ABC subunit C [bacterium]